MVAERSSTPRDPVDPDDLERAELPTVFRGADHQVVQRLLRLAAEEIRHLRGELHQLREATPEAAPPPQELDEEALTARLGEEAAMVLTAAREAAAQVRTRAEEKVARLVREAQDEAAETRETTERDRALLLDAAREESEAIVAAAERLRTEAVGRVEAELETARLRAQDLVAEAQTRRSEVLEDLETRQRALLDEIAELARMRSDAADLFDRVAAGLHRQSARLRDTEPGGAPRVTGASGPSPSVSAATPSDDPSDSSEQQPDAEVPDAETEAAIESEPAAETDAETEAAIESEPAAETDAETEAAIE
ncbi:MAG: hypothetical protein AAFZ07_28180, partial [Actinomycetota bacterium]